MYVWSHPDAESHFTSLGHGHDDDDDALKSIEWLEESNSVGEEEEEEESHQWHVCALRRDTRDRGEMMFSVRRLISIINLLDRIEHS